MGPQNTSDSNVDTVADQNAINPIGVAERNSEDEVSWTASEFVHHQKSTLWYVGIIFAVAATCGLSYFLTGDWITVASIAVLGILLAMGGWKKPRTLNYSVSDQGIFIGDKAFGFDDFQAFSVHAEGAFQNFELVPQKRWSPASNLYLSQEDSEKVFEIISRYLPFEERKKDPIDSFLNKIHF
ncbi:hypothetical protein KC930_01065 [Candidatus Saccharibacteria bacterium]|nr:hypothetical protein [Candidatus Saccharibacteria bacterium]